MEEFENFQSLHQYLESLPPDELEKIDGRECLRLRSRWNTLHQQKLFSAIKDKKPNEIAAALSNVVIQNSSELVLDAFAGNVEAAQALTLSLDNCERGVMVYAMWKAKAPREAFREYFKGAWDHDHRWVIGAAGSRTVLTRMFRYAEFELPSHLPDTVRVWRGTSHLTKKKAQAGYSWTTDRDVACWFTVVRGDIDEMPLVLAADVPKQDIAMYHDERNESEAVLLNPPDAWIDGDINDWMLASDRHIEEKKQRQNADELKTLDGAALTSPA